MHKRPSSLFSPYHWWWVFGIILALILLLFFADSAHGAKATRIIFLHHSVGQNLTDQGGVREGFTALGYEFYDHGYNEEGLRLANGDSANQNFNVPDDNTNPDGLAAIFSQPLHNPPDNTFSHLMQYDVIIFKSCFPTSKIASDEQLQEYKSYYSAIRQRIDQYPDKLFIAFTQPPEVPGDSDPGEATRARAWATWLKSTEFTQGRPNLVVFDFFSLLAGNDNFLRSDYRVDNADGHPNEHANQVIAPQFVKFVDQAIRSFKPSMASTAPTPAQPAATEAIAPTAESAPAAGAPSGHLVDDFEKDSGTWTPSSDDRGTNFNCQVESKYAYAGRGALHLQYTIIAGGWGTCELYYDPTQNWSNSQGIHFWLHSTSQNEPYILRVTFGQQDKTSPFEASLQTSPESASHWSEVNVPWSSFTKPDWAPEGSLNQVDPSQVLSIGFTVWSEDKNQSGELWMDDLTLLGPAQQANPPEQPSEPSASAPQGAVPITPPPTQPPQQANPLRRFCPGSMALPLIVVGLALWRKRRGL